MKLTHADVVGISRKKRSRACLVRLPTPLLMPCTDQSVDVRSWHRSRGGNAAGSPLLLAQPGRGRADVSACLPPELGWGCTEETRRWRRGHCFPKGRNVPSFGCSIVPHRSSGFRLPSNALIASRQRRLANDSASKPSANTAAFGPTMPSID